MVAYIAASGDTVIPSGDRTAAGPFSPFLARLRRPARPAGPVTTKKKPAEQDTLSRFRHSLHPARERPLDLAPGFVASEACQYWPRDSERQAPGDHIRERRPARVVLPGSGP